MQKLRWEVIRSRHPRPHVVYYNVHLPDGRRAAVARTYSERGDGSFDTNAPWRWKIYKAQERPGQATWEIEQEGTAPNMPLAKFAVREALGVYIASR